MEKTTVIVYRRTADASQQYRQGTAANIARVSTSAQSGNLAEAAKNHTLILPLVPLEQPQASSDKPAAPIAKKNI
jgi:hypothetical protein